MKGVVKKQKQKNNVNIAPIEPKLTLSEAKIKLRLLEDEIKRRENNKNLFSYNTGECVHKKQLAFHRCQKRNRWVFGGNRSGKTECGAVEAIWLARGIHPYRQNKPDCDGWVVSLSTQVQRDVAQRKILHYLNPDWIVDVTMLSGKKASLESGVIDTITIRNVFGGTSRIGFKSCDQGREKFQGTSLNWVWFDEEPPYDIYIECCMRVMDRAGDIFGTMTPLKGLTWVYNTIYLNEAQNDEVWHIHMEWSDNPFLDPTQVKLMTDNFSEDELNSRRFGLFSSFGGIVYNEFDPSIHIIDPFEVPHDWYDKIAIDPGLKNPLSAHWYAVDFDGNVYVVAEHYESNRDIIYHSKAIHDICQKLRWPHNSNGMVEALIDPAANQKNLASAKSVSELFYDNGILVNTRVNKDVFSGIQRVKSYLKNADGKAKLFIFRNCVNMIREIKGYFWGNDDAPIKKDDHAMDELRYYIMSRPENTRKEGKTPVQKDKERRIRELKKGWYQ